MIIDSSALVAVLAREPESHHLLATMVTSQRCSIGAATLVESTIVLKNFTSVLAADLRTFMREARIDVLPFDGAQAEVAQEAYRRFGRGGGTKAGLNFGDCLAYAASVVSGRPLLYKGDDFTHTDVISALP